MFKVIRSNVESAITPPLIVRFCSNLVQSLITSRFMHCKYSRSKVKGQDQRSKVKVTASDNLSAVKRYKTATVRLTDFKLRVDIAVKVEND